MMDSESTPDDDEFPDRGQPYRRTDRRQGKGYVEQNRELIEAQLQLFGYR